MTEAVLIAIVTVLGGILVELIRARRQQNTVVGAVTSNGGSSMRDLLDRVAEDVKEIRAEQNKHGARLAVVEARVSDQLIRLKRVQ